jgi:hypothetical protein
MTHENGFTGTHRSGITGTHRADGTGTHRADGTGAPETGIGDGHRSGVTGAHETGRDGLFPAGEREELSTRLEQAVQNFVDSPRQAVEMADHAFAQATAQLAEAVAERQRALRERWQGEGPGTGTEELRVLLRQYRETTEQLLRL